MDKTRKLLTLVLIKKDGQLLLGMKKRGFGAGRWNGFGGKVEAGEAIEDAAKREVLEEVGISIGQLNKAGILDFEFEGGSDILEVHIFRAGSFEGTPQETEEMRPQLFSIGQIPYSEMWPPDQYWIPIFLNNQKFKGRFYFGEGDQILKKELIEIESL